VVTELDNKVTKKDLMWGKYRQPINSRHK
jgi:hypothetical protein